MIAIRFKDVSLQFGEHPLLSKVSFVIQKGERVAILGRNGSGKSTLLKLLQGAIEPDSGVIEHAKGLVVATMDQQFEGDMHQTVYECLDQHHTPQYEWETHRIDEVISLLNLPAEKVISLLSGGQLRRLSLALAILNHPEVLLLDEPTNHLDIESIEWLEGFLLKQGTTLIFITHDRDFMQRLANRIFEIDITKLITYDCSYQEFLKQRATRLDAEEKERALFDKKLAQEEVWIRQGIKARRTRNEGRVRALKKMREDYRERLNRQGAISVEQQRVGYSSKLLIETNGLTYEVDDRLIVDNLSLMILRGDRIGIIGANGCGKTTLINLLTQTLSPTQGSVRHGAQLKIAVFDQLRDQLDLDKSAIDNVADGASHVDVNGKSTHVISYLQDFLFTPEKARCAASSLSGGERNRLLLAKVLAQQSTLLILDEPTNDLDMESLEFLESYLAHYAGTLLLVSHDRAFLNNSVTSTLVYEGMGKWRGYVGGYDDYLRQRDPIVPTSATPSSKSEQVVDTKQEKAKKSIKLSYKEQRELDQLPDKIESLEQKIEILQEAMCAVDFYQQEKEVITSKQSELAELEQSLEYAYERWSLLSEKTG